MKLSDLKLDYPTLDHTIAQEFGQNANSIYVQDGLLGHPGVDFNSDYDADIFSTSRGLGRIYKFFNRDNPDLMKYRAVCELIDLDDCVIELTYGHCNHINCQVGQALPKQKLATVGNTGLVYQGNHLVTEAEKLAGSTAGRHLHFQMRKCQKVLKSEYNDKFLQNADGSLHIENGYYFTYKENGYAGCIDPVPFLENNSDTKIMIIQTEISFLTRVVSLLKQLLKLKKG